MNKTPFLKFILDGTSESGKTNRYHVYSNINSSFLGTIKWYSNWRRYIFCSDMGTVFDATCLDEISDFLKKLMCERNKR